MDKRTVFVATLLSAALFVGCFSTRDIPAGQIHRIMQGQHGKELILRTPEGKPVRFGPRSSVRFQLADRRWTAWYRGHELRVNRRGVCVEKGCQPPHKGWQWDEVQSAQVKNLSGGKTYAAVFISVAVVAVTVAVIAAAVGGKGGGGGGKLKLKGLFPRRGGGGRSVGLRPRGGVRAGGLRPRGTRVRGLRPRGTRVGGLRPRGTRVGVRAPRAGRHHGHGHVVRVPDVGVEVGEIPPPEPDPDAPATDNTPAPDTEPPPGMPAQPVRLTLHSNPGATSPLFTRRTRRRATIRFIGGLEGGGDLLIRDGGTAQAMVGMRILDVLELGVGAHLLVHRGSGVDEPHRASWMGVFRLNLHFDLDARRRVALPIGVDVGTGHATIYTRLNLGVRVRLTRHLSLGLYPFNPTYTAFKDDTLKRKFGWWSFPTTIDLSFAL